VYFAEKNMYQPISAFEVQATMPSVRVNEAKATSMNGYIKGEIKNNSEEEINGRYVKFEFFTKNGTSAGTEYLEINSLKSLETKTYEVKFRYNNVYKFIITSTDVKE